MAEPLLRAGVARRLITPPPGIFLVGYGDRAKGNRGCHDDLTATALVLEDDHNCLVIVALDLLCLNEYIVDRIRVAVAPLQPILCCSHTHSGPIGYADKRSSRANQTYIEHLITQVIKSIQQAQEELLPARLSLGRSSADIAVNRREHTSQGQVIIGENPAGPVDRSVQVVSVILEDGRRLATLVNFACHGTILGPDNLLASADWIGAMRLRVEHELGGLALFLQGATADLNPRMGWGQSQVWEMVQEQGERVAQAAVQAARNQQVQLVVTPLSLRRQEILLPFEAKVTSLRPPTTYRKRILSMAGLPPFLWPLTDLLLNQRYPWRSKIQPGSGALEGQWCTPLRINAARLGELAITTFGSETFTEIGVRVKEISPAAHTLFASVSDGCIGYLPTPIAHQEGGYEVDLAPYAYRFPSQLAENSATLAIVAAMDLLHALWEPI